MKTKQVVLCSVIASSLFVVTSFAIPVNISMSGGVAVIAAPSSDLSDFGDATVLSWLTGDVAAYNTAFATSYPAPTANLDGTPLQKVKTGSGPSSIALALGAYDYLFFHWGGQGGGWAQAYYIGGSSGSFEFSAPPGGPPDVGGLSFYSFYGPTPTTTTITTVPDVGGTFALLGIGSLGLIAFGRKLKTA